MKPINVSNLKVHSLSGGRYYFINDPRFNPVELIVNRVGEKTIDFAEVTLRTGKSGAYYEINLIGSCSDLSICTDQERYFYAVLSGMADSSRERLLASDMEVFDYLYKMQDESMYYTIDESTIIRVPDINLLQGERE